MKRYNYNVNANVVNNPECEKCPNSEARHTDNAGICKKVKSVVDGLPIRCVGPWANDKIYYLVQYFQIFAKGMSKKWNKLRYVEICSGPGRCSTRDGREQDGSSLAILKNEQFQYLSDAIFIDYSQKVVDTLSKRIDKLKGVNNAHAILGDYKKPETITDALKKYSPDSLTLCFIDPTDCSVPFETIREIYRATNGRCDFLISFFDGLDFHRNSVNAAIDPSYHKLRDKYLGFLGITDFFDRKEVRNAALGNRYDDLSMMFRNCYTDRLSGMGLSYQGWKPVKNFYNILYASSNSKGLEFWQKATKYDPNGQQEFIF